MPFADYGRYDALGLAELVRTGQVSAGELLDEALARTAAVNPKINAVIHLMEGRAREAITAGLPEGPFRGVPFLIKDLLDGYAGEPMRCGSRLLKDFVPPEDEEMTRRYKAAGLGDLRQDQHAGARLTERHRARAVRADAQPLEPRANTSSGSSGGSAAAVAARIVPAANANDGGGSIRTPASNCGLVGPQAQSRPQLRPDHRRPTCGGASIGEHVVTRTVRDCAALLDATAGDYPQRSRGCPHPSGRTSRKPGATPAGCASRSASIRAWVERCMPRTAGRSRRPPRVLERLGHEVVEVRLPLPPRPSSTATLR